MLKYNPATDTWSNLAASPDQHFLGPSVYYNGKVYVVAGFGAAGTSNVLQIYDVAGNSWTLGAPMPASLSDHAAALYNGIIYVAGGYTGSGASNAVYAYNIASNTWSTLANLPVALYLPGFGAINGKVYIAGGNDGSTELNTLYVYDIASNSWTTGAVMPQGATGPGSAVVNGKLWVFGGGFPTTRTNNYIYDPATNTWATGPSLNVNRLWLYGAVAQNKVFAMGGDTTPGIPVNANEYSVAGGPCGTPTNTPTNGPTFTPTATNSPTATTPPTNTFTPTFTNTPVITNTPGITDTPTETATPCVITFTDVQPTDYFYEAVTYLWCHGVISGYSDNTFRPYNNTTRGQMTKIVVLGFGIPIWTPSPSATPTFNDVPPTDTFYTYIETAARNNIVSGYADGSFRPYNNVTRGQLSKIIVIGATIANGWPLINPPTPTFSDVPPNSPFYTYIETAYCHGIISGYADGTFRPYNDATRGQIAKIQYLAILNQTICGTVEDVSIANFAFDPQTITITVGSAIKWTNNDTVTHTSTSDTNVWDSGNIAPTDSYTHTFNTAGSYPYHCAIHTNMHGTVVVTTR